MALRILIVDDSPAMRTFIRRTIQLSGLQTDACAMAGNGREALDVLEHEPIDLIISDINMPVMSGQELLAAIEADPRLCHIPVVVISTDSTHCRRLSMLALGAKGYVKKPFQPELLRFELERVLGAIHE